MQYKYCFWDLDGTVIDSSPSVTHSVQYALKKMGIEPPPEEELLCFIGPPLVDAFARFYNMSHEDSVRATAFYREIYRAGNIYQCSIYDGILDILKELKRRGIVSVLATCKPHEFANMILDRLGIADYFAFVSGPEMDGTRDAKSEVIAYAAEHLGITDFSEILMIGDHANDVRGAAYHNIDCAGVLWGFGGEEVLVAEGAKYICKTPDDLKRLLLENM